MAYEVTLHYQRLGHMDANQTMDRLEQAGCTEALALWGNENVMAFAFESEAATEDAAVLQCKAQIAKALPEAVLVKVTVQPLTDI